MNRFFLLFMINVLAISVANSQTCNPETSLPDSVVISPLPYSVDFPENGIQDTACVNSYYETVLTFNIPTTYEYLGNVLPIGFVSIAEEGGIAGLPASLSYSCNPPNCTFLPDTSGCILIYGTAIDGDIGEYDLTMEAIFNVSGFNIPQVLPGAVIDGNYFLNIQAEGSLNCSIVGLTETPGVDFGISARPNPSEGYTEFVINTEVGGQFSFVIHDLLGRTIFQKQVELFEGENTISFDATEVASGMYVYTLAKEKQTISGKLLIARQ